MNVSAASIISAPDLADALDDPLLWLKYQDYSWGGCQARPYRRGQPQEFLPQPYLPYLWQQTRDSGRSRLGGLPALFCGMSDLSVDAITSYLAGRLVLVLGEWRGNSTVIDPADPLPENLESLLQPEFVALGFAFPAGVPIVTSRDADANSMFIGYTFFQPAWRTPQQTVLMYLGLAYFFQEFRLVSMHGIRYADNRLTARLAGKFGWQDLGTVPNYMLREATGELAAATISTLSRESLVEQLRGVIRGLAA